MTVANRQASAYIIQLFPGLISCNAISVSGIHANVPPADILAFAEVSKQARGLPIDLERLAADLAAGTAKTHQMGNMCTYQWPLTHSCNFEHGASPFGVYDTYPQASLFTEIERTRVQGEGYMKPVYAAQAVRVRAEATYLDVGIGRGVRQNEGKFENSVGLITADTKSRFAPSLKSWTFDVHMLPTITFRFKSTNLISE